MRSKLEIGMGRSKGNGPVHYGETSRFLRKTMCGQDAAYVRHTSDWDQVTCTECQRLHIAGCGAVSRRRARSDVSR